MTDLKNLKEKAWRFYDKWRKSEIYSPAFKSKVRISLKGWRHITGASGYKKRSSKDVYRRLKLLPYAKEIIEKSTTIQNITKKHNRTYYALEAMLEVKEKEVKQLRKIRVIIIKDKLGNRIFYSVMDKKLNKNRAKK